MNNVYLILLGPAGTGKTRVLDEIHKFLSDKGLNPMYERYIKNNIDAGKNIEHCISIDTSSIINKPK